MAKNKKSVQISEEAWKAYTDKLYNVSATAGKKMEEYVLKNGLDDRNALIDYAYGLVTKYSEGTSALAAQMYDEIAAAENALTLSAEVIATPSYGEVAKTVHGTLKKSKNEKSLGGAIQYLVKRNGADTVLHNALRDHAQFAWIPGAGETCSFCRMLASNGWRYMSKKALKNGHAEHIHANCRCTYAIRFSEQSNIQGYDPDKYYQEYKNALLEAAEYDDYGRGEAGKAAVNRMRRLQYQSNKELADKIRAQKREAYAKRKGNGTETAFNNQVELLKKYGNLQEMMLNGSSEDLMKWAELQKISGKNEKAVLQELSKSADNWETILKAQTESQMQHFSNELLRVATDEELGALNMWSGETYANINKYLRYGIQVDDISIRAAKNIETVLNKVTTTEDIIVHRGTGTKHIFEKMTGDWKNNPDVLAGQKFTDLGFTATSPLEEGGFSGVGATQAELFIKVPTGTHGAYIAQEAHNELEKEFLLQRGYSYRIIKAEYRSNPLFPDENDLKVWCEVIIDE